MGIIILKITISMARRKLVLSSLPIMPSIDFLSEPKGINPNILLLTSIHGRVRPRTNKTKVMATSTIPIFFASGNFILYRVYHIGI